MTDARIPRYQRIRDSVAQHIARQQWRVDQAIPTEAELARTHGVAVGTVRKAIDKLVAEGMIERVHGKGMFVRRPDFSIRFFRSLPLPIRKHRRPARQQRSFGAARPEPPPDVRKQLNLGPKQKAIHLKRNRSWEDKMILIEDIWLPADHFDGILKAKLEALAPLLYPVYEHVWRPGGARRGNAFCFASRCRHSPGVGDFQRRAVAGDRARRIRQRRIARRMATVSGGGQRLQVQNRSPVTVKGRVFGTTKSADPRRPRWPSLPPASDDRRLAPPERRGLDSH